MKQIRHIDIRTEIELREEQDKPRTIVGKIPYNSRSVDMGFLEVITPTAFTKTLTDGADVKALYAHDSAKVLGRTKNGTLRLVPDADGLVCECDLPDTSYARDVYELIKRGDVTTMSFGFYPVKVRQEIEDGKAVDYLQEVRLIEVSFAVAFPAYEATNSEARSVRGIDLNAFASAFEKDKATLTNEDRTILENVSAQIGALIEPSGTPDSGAAASTPPAVDFLASLHAAAMKE